MHIKKNVFGKRFNMVMDMKGKIEDNIKARIDILLFCHRKNIELIYDGPHVITPKASFALDKNG